MPWIPVIVHNSADLEDVQQDWRGIPCVSRVANGGLTGVEAAICDPRESGGREGRGREGGARGEAGWPDLGTTGRML